MAQHNPIAAPPDLEDRAESAMEWTRRNAKPVGAAVLVIAAVVAIWLVYDKTQATKNARAQQALSSARQTYALGNLPLARTDLQAIATRYDGTSAAKEAKVLIAQIAYDQGKPEEGLAALKDASASGPLAATVIAMRAAGLEQEKKFEDAAKAYLDAADHAPTTPDKHRYQAQAAQAYASADKKDEAAKIWRELLNTNDTFYAQEAALRLGELTAKTATAG
jgi:predicted negative regulator of RcsB-dependent stress response